MKNRKWLLLATVVLMMTLVLSACTKEQAQSSRSERWEYQAIYSRNLDEAARFNALGAEGWELVTYGSLGVNSAFIFKRKLP